MKELEAILTAFRDSMRCESAIWTARDANSTGPVLLARSSTRALLPDRFPEQGSMLPTTSNDGTQTVIAVPAVRRTWLSVSMCDDPTGSADRHIRLLLPVVSQLLRGAQEVEHAAIELAERYEEITLLYAIGDILGQTVTLEEAATTILTEISETVGTKRASLLVHDPASDTLLVTAAIGTDTSGAQPIRVDDTDCISARVFRTHHPLNVADGEMECDAERPYRLGGMLSVPIIWNTPSGGDALGVVNLSDRRSTEPYSAGDLKLVAAIATQIGTAIKNARLVKSSIEQQRLLQEMYLAHDLQMKLLPKTSIVAPEVTVAARVVPAESVGGDFYHLFRMTRSRTGVMIGDVSGHGYRAALIMALAMSASAIHAQSAKDPGEMLSMLLGTLREELSTTEMYISLFYGVVDHGAAKLTFANTGHPHAFTISTDGTVNRLRAGGPPLGLSDGSPGAESIPWRKGEDTLVLFTDGIVDARNPAGERVGEHVVLELIRENRGRTPHEIVSLVFDMLEAYSAGTPSPDDLTLVVLRS
ncbi:MAG: GAF domain-containing SpoIIE family protein phosphatase [Gemmatimonadaceae bacterium]